jgi:hypothetical protein
VNNQQSMALREHCRLGCETALPRFAYVLREAGVSVVLTVNSGYE